MQLARKSLIAIAGVVLSAVIVPANAAAASPPTIGNTWSYGVTQTGATLEAEINPQDPSIGVYYQFQVVANTSEFQPEVLCPPEIDWRPLDGCNGASSPSALPIGFIEHGTESRAAKVDLADAGVTLQPDTTYHYRVLAARKVVTEDTIQWEDPAVVGQEQTFTTLATGPAPRVQSESVSHITSTDATLEAQIDPGGRETTYEFDLEAPSCLSRGFGACEASGGMPIYQGTIPAGSAGQAVSVDVDSAWYGHNLLPNTLYGYRVIARSASGSAVGRAETFRTSSGLPPAIDAVSVSHLTPSDATLEAQIDTEGLPTSYQFDLAVSPCSKHGGGCDLMVPIPLPSGNLLGSFLDQTVSVDLNSVGVKLGGGEYSYSVTATNEAGSAVGRGEIFEAPPGMLDPLPPSTGTSDGATPSGTTQPPGSGDQTAMADGGASQSSPPGPASLSSATAVAGTGTAIADLMPADRHGNTKHRHQARRLAKAGKHKHKHKR